MNIYKIIPEDSVVGVCRYHFASRWVDTMKYCSFVTSISNYNYFTNFASSFRTSFESMFTIEA